MFILYQNCPVLAKKYPFLIRIRAVFRTASGTVISYVTYAASWKKWMSKFFYVHRSRKHWKCKYCGIKLNNDVNLAFRSEDELVQFKCSSIHQHNFKIIKHPQNHKYTFNSMKNRYSTMITYLSVLIECLWCDGCKWESGRWYWKL